MREYEYQEFEGVAFNLHTTALEDKAVLGLSGRLEPKLQYLFSRLVRKGDTVLDIGANSGFHSICLVNITGQEGEVHSFEPVPYNYRKMTTNIHLNGYENIITYPIALGSENSARKMNVIREGEFEQGNHSLASNEKIEGILKEKVTSINVQVRTLDSIAENFERLDFIKIDVEGYEIEVLKGAVRVIEKFKPIIIMEWVEPRLKHLAISHADFASILQDHYICFEINCDDPQHTSKVTALSPYNFDRPMSRGSWDLVCLPLRRFEASIQETN